MKYEKGGLFVDGEHLETFAENFGRGLKPDGESGGGSLAAEVRKAMSVISSSKDAMSLKWDGMHNIPGHVRWLLDNHYLVRREGLIACQDISSASHLRTAEGKCVFYLAAAALMRSGHYSVDADRMESFLRGFQKAFILENNELCLFVSGMRAFLIIHLAQRCKSPLDDAGDMEDEFRAVFEALRYLSNADLSGVLERADCVEQLLCGDPMGIYGSMDEKSRSSYRRRLSSLSRKYGIPEYKAAQRVLSLAKNAQGKKRHVGWWILFCPLGKELRSPQGGFYIAFNLLASLFLSLLIGFASQSTANFFLVLLPVSELVKSGTDFVLLHLSKPRHLPRLALDGGVPPEGKTLCAVSTILSGAQDGTKLAGLLRRHYFVSRGAGDNLLFALIADLPDTTEAEYPGAAAVLSAAAEEIEKLNSAYGNMFFLLTRDRVPAGNRFMGWERKRGALLETMRFLRGEKSGISCSAGNAVRLQGVRYLIALDSDTRLSPGSAKAMVGAMMHPMNSPVTDTKRGIVIEGHGIIAPRVGTDLSSATKTDFSHIFAPQGGTDPYCSECSELYMDMWSSGGYAGKGIIDIDAYLACRTREFPENLILSHDAPEGAFLRCGYMSDTELSDGFPSAPLPYYRRQERWTRGDWQNIVWLSRRGRALRPIERFRLFDSLRRSLVPISVFAAIVFSFFLPNKVLAAALAAIAAMLSQLLLTSAEALFRSDESRGEKYHSRLFVGVGGGLVRTLLRFLFLPHEAWISFTAIVRSLWRMTVSRKNLLQWQTAGQSEGGKSGLACHYRAMWFAALSGLVLMLLSPSVIGKAAGFLWLLCPVCALLLALPSKAESALSAPDRRYLLSCAGDIWKYFDEFLTEENHFLPPDNYQSQPPAGLARRTSPTNIGLCLLSVAAARDMGLIGSHRAATLIEKMVSTLEALPKWHGHLYNWYDISTLLPLKPEYVSTVDSGNLCASLIALKAFLDSLGIPELSSRVKALADGMDFAPLYDDSRDLFYIGIDINSSEKPNSHYDLMASEARLTAYLTVARGDVPRRHWQKLSRALFRCGPYRGLASWTGTMFEYLMPELLLPLMRDSLIWESTRFCLFVQRRRSAGLPWGISESAYYSLDPGLSYRYKAHGCSQLALKRGMDEEFVIAPYACFLALNAAPKASLKNLRVLEGMGMRGHYGFWEAMDMTPGRCEVQDPGIVRCVMAHHLGMSMLSCANVLFDGIMTRRFMADPAMEAFSGLLEEKVPLGGTVMRKGRDVNRSKPQRQSGEGYSFGGVSFEVPSPRCSLLSGRAYSMLVTDSGLCRGLWGAVSPYVSPESPLSGEKGVDIILNNGAASTSLLPDAGDEGTEYRWNFDSRKAVFSLDTSGFSSSVSITLGRDDVGEKRSIRILCRPGSDIDGCVHIGFRPLMAANIDYVNHPSYYGLGISAKSVDGMLVLRRLERGKCPEIFMCVASDRKSRFTLGSGAAMGRACGEYEVGPRERWSTDPFVNMDIDLNIPEGTEKTIDFAIAMALSEDEAVEAAKRLLTMNEEDSAALPRTAAALLGMGSGSVRKAFSYLPYVSFPAVSGHGICGEKDGLWRFGISGDIPIICVQCFAETQMERAREMLDIHLFLCGCGAEFDLVFISHDGAAYRKGINTALVDLLWRNGGELLSNTKGGVHIIEDSVDITPIIAAAALVTDLGSGEDLPHFPYRRAALALPQRRGKTGNIPKYQWQENGCFEFYVNHSLPPRAWQNILTNARFGYIAADSGCGGMWYLNAKENQLTPWPGSANISAGSERLMADTEDGLYSLFASGDGCPTRVSYGFGFAKWEKRIGNRLYTTTAFVPTDADARVFIIDGSGPREGSIIWQAELMLCGDRRDKKYCVTERKGRLLRAINGRAIKNAKPFVAAAYPGFDAFTCDAASALAMDFNENTGQNAESVFAMKIPADEKIIVVCGCDDEEKLLELCCPERAEESFRQTEKFWREFAGKFTVESGCSPLDKLMNGWISYQAMACRIMGRSSLYQSGGAVGFRDQLQDCTNLLSLSPKICRKQIIASCAHQYTEGDVMHWWHQGDGVDRGVRTRCSDDLLWLIWSVCEYVGKTGDRSILGESVPYLHSPELDSNEGDRYEKAEVSGVAETVAKHSMRAFFAVMRRGTGPHGLLRMGSGDWNDGFNAVKGESQWLTWFFIICARRFQPFAEDLGINFAQVEKTAAALVKSAENSWDGKWYRRGYYADGTPLGSSENPECRIDSIAQSFAAFCPDADPQHVDTALKSAADILFDRENGLVKLFSPPFEGIEKPGYIRSYGPGFRENGGQYTHGALWLVMALMERGRVEEGWTMLKAMLPAGKDVRKYMAEPYVIAADVYSAEGHRGEGGWSWYTGSAGWLFRIVTETVFGLRLVNGKLIIRPRLPRDLSQSSVSFLGHSIEYSSGGITVDGREYGGEEIEL